MTWEDLDWAALDRLRADRFLHGPGAGGAYWETRDDLASYDFTYGERIGWKWDHVLRELRSAAGSRRRRQAARSPCSTGVAAAASLHGGSSSLSVPSVSRRSPSGIIRRSRATSPAEAAQQAFPGLDVAQATPGFLAADQPIGLLVVSHVLNELPPDALTSLRALALRADAILWVEPGTHAISRQLGALRDELRAAFRIVAPCTHELGCPMFAAGNERHWCHFFAAPPPAIYADSHWVKFGQRAGIDLRSLPYAFLALERAGAATAPGLAPDRALSRVIGRVEHFKPYARC